MQYPLISEYVTAICDSNDSLDRLSFLMPVLDDDGEPYHSSGAFAVVFKMIDRVSGELYALKCFTTEQKGRLVAYNKIAQELKNINSGYLVSVEYYDNELFVNSSASSETLFPVLLMDWVDGVTMEQYLLENYSSSDEMKWLTYRFCELASWIHQQSFAHGDLKPDNIMVRPNGELVLIDYDAMYVPSMLGQNSPTLGSRDYSHPLRTAEDFNEAIDDFALSSMALSLKAMSLDPGLFSKYGTSDGMLLTQRDYLNLGESKIIKELSSYLYDPELCRLLGNFLLAYNQKDLSLHSFRNFIINKPQ